MRLPGADGELPAAHAPPRHRSLARVLLERERNVAPPGDVDQWLARDEMERTGILLIAGEGDDDAGPIERTDALECLQGVKNHHVPALHVRAPGARGEGVEPHEALPVALESRVEVPDQQEAP